MADARPGDEPPPGAAREAWLEARNKELHAVATTAQEASTRIRERLVELGNKERALARVVASLLGGDERLRRCKRCRAGVGRGFSIYDPEMHFKDCEVGDALAALSPEIRQRVALAVEGGS